MWWTPPWGPGTGWSGCAAEGALAGRFSLGAGAGSAGWSFRNGMIYGPTPDPATGVCALTVGPKITLQCSGTTTPQTPPLRIPRGCAARRGGMSRSCHAENLG
ncbi:hypothetical protein TPA0909_38680 [Streptomyces albus]|nr:hypothetical protein TPA0909_38680 [Streptomyces albus]